jgi:hypothetical protein
MKQNVEVLWNSNPDFPSTQRWKDFTENAIRFTDNVWYANQTIADYDSNSLNQPKFYRWATESMFNQREMKEGQTTQETAAARVSQYQTIERRVIVDVIVDKAFEDAGADQKFHAYRTQIQNTHLEWLKEGKSSDEVIYYKDWDSFYSSDSLVRDALRLWTKRSDAGMQDLLMRVPSILMLTAYFGNRKARRALGKLNIFELCARFGKTIWSLSLFQLSGHNTLLFGAYYLSSFGSIKNEVSRFTQFANMRTVDTREENWQSEYSSYIQQGYKVVILASLQATDTGWEKLENFVSSTKPGLIIFDEVDFGVHTDRSSARIASIVDGAEVVAMSGTNADRMNNGYFEISRFQSYTMEEMLELKHALEKDPTIGDKAYAELKRTIKDEWLETSGPSCSLDELPEMSFYQRYVQSDTDMTYQKLLQDPEQHEAVISRDSRIIAGVDEQFTHLGIRNVVKKANLELHKMRKTIQHKLNDVIEFVPYNTMNKNLDTYADIRQKAFDSAEFGYKVVVVHGGIKQIANKEGLYTRGQYVKIETAEHYVKDVKVQAIKDGYKGVWVIATSMCQRSFSIGSLDIIMLSYDKGDAGGTNQRMSRGSTPYDGKDASLIISNSFAKERDDKINMILQKMAKSRAVRTGEDLYTAIREVKLATSMFTIGDDGRSIQYDVDSYLHDLALAKVGIENNIKRTITHEVMVLSDDELEQWKHGTKKKGSASTTLDTTFHNDEDNDEDKEAGDFKERDANEVNEILLVVENLIENSHLIDSLGQAGSIRVGFVKSVQNILSDDEKKDAFYDEFQIDPSLFYAILLKRKDIEFDIETQLSINRQTGKEKATEIYSLDW